MPEPSAPVAAVESQALTTEMESQAAVAAVEPAAPFTETEVSAPVEAVKVEASAPAEINSETQPAMDPQQNSESPANQVPEVPAPTSEVLATPETQSVEPVIEKGEIKSDEITNEAINETQAEVKSEVA